MAAKVATPATAGLINNRLAAPRILRIVIMLGMYFNYPRFAKIIQSGP